MERDFVGDFVLSHKSQWGNNINNSQEKSRKGLKVQS